MATSQTQMRGASRWLLFGLRQEYLASFFQDGMDLVFPGAAQPVVD